MRESAVSKHTFISQKLAVAIRRGEFGDGGRLPSDRQLAEDFHVSYITARRAVTELVQQGLAERRGRHGTFAVHADAPSADGELRRLNFICSAYESSALQAYVQLMQRFAAERGLELSVCRVEPTDHEAAVAAIAGRDPSIVLMHEYFGWDRVRRALVAAANRVVLIGSRLDDQGVHTVIGHDAQAMELACRHLAEHGHRRTAFVMHHPELGQARLRLATWRVIQHDCGDPTDLDARLVLVDVPTYGNMTESTYDTVSRFLAAGAADVTALICVNDEIALGAIAACRDAGRQVPADMSVFCLSNSVIGKFSQPPITCSEIRQERTVACAYDVLQRLCRGDMPTWDTLHFIPPTLVPRQSVAPRR